MTENTLNKHVVTSQKYPIRFSFFKAFTGEMEYDKKLKEDVRKWSTMILIPKKDTATITKLKKLINAVAVEKWGASIPKNLKISFRDGDKETNEGGVPDGTEAGAEPYSGNHFMTVRSGDKPGVVDENREEILSAGHIVSGDYGCVSLDCYAWDNKNGKGISFGLVNVQLLSKGEPLGNPRIAPDKDFTPIAQAEGNSDVKEGAAPKSGRGIFDDNDENNNIPF